MYEYYLSLYELLTGSTGGSYMPIFVLAAGLIAHLYWMMMKEKKNARQQYSERQVAQKEYDNQRNSEILAVVKENTAAITANTAVSGSLKTLFESMSADVKSSVSRTHDRIDEVLKDTSEIKTLVRAKCRGARNGGDAS